MIKGGVEYKMLGYLGFVGSSLLVQLPMLYIGNRIDDKRGDVYGVGKYGTILGVVGAVVGGIGYVLLGGTGLGN